MEACQGIGKVGMKMCEAGTDKCTCPDCPETCQGHGDKRDYAADLAIVESIKTDYWQAVEVEAIAFAELACTSLEWYIRKVMELEAQLSEAQAREAGLREALDKLLNFISKSNLCPADHELCDFKCRGCWEKSLLKNAPSLSPSPAAEGA